MRKILVIICFLALPMFLMAQMTGLTSLDLDFSQGLFPNDLDAALNVGEEFSQLQDLYLFGGVGNLRKTDNIGPATIDENNPLWVGFFMPGKLPFSFFDGGFYQGYDIASPPSGTTYTEGSVVVPAGTTDTTYRWITTSTTDTHTIPVYERIIQQIQFLTIIGQLNLGLFLGVDLLNNTDATNNYTQSYTRNYNTALAAEIPTPVLDFSRQAEYIDLRDDTDPTLHGIRNSFTASLPVFIKIGPLKQTGVLSGTFSSTDGTTSDTGGANPVTNNLTSVPVDPADVEGLGGAFTNILDDRAIRKTSNVNIGLNYILEMPGFFNSNPKNEFSAGVNGNIDIMNAEFSTVNNTQDVTFVPGDAAFTNGARSESSASYTIAPAIYFDTSLWVNHSFYFQLPGMAEFGIRPNLWASLSSEPDLLDPTDTLNNLTIRTTVNSVDGDGDGAFTTAVVDTITTATTTYTNTTIDQEGAISATKTIKNETSIQASLPSTLKIQPEKWLFGIVLGATPYLQADFATSTINNSTSTTTTTTVDGAGTQVGQTTVTNVLSTETTKTSTTDFNLGINHDFGVYFDINDSIHLSVNVAAAASGGVWDFRNLVVQGIVKLPNKKE